MKDIIVYRLVLKGLYYEDRRISVVISNGDFIRFAS